MPVGQAQGGLAGDVQGVVGDISPIGHPQPAGGKVVLVVVVFILLAALVFWLAVRKGISGAEEGWKEPAARGAAPEEAR